MTLYCTSEDVINFTQITPVKLGIDTKKEPNKLETIITKWIQHASSLIDQYTKNPKKENEIPPVYENVCIRITAHMIAAAEKYKNNNLVRINDWTVRTVPTEIFSQAEKDDLETFVIETVNKRNSTINMITISGDGYFEGNDKFKWD